MSIKSAQLCYLHKGELHFTTAQSIDGVNHVKALPWLSIVESVEGSYSISLGGGRTYRTGAHGFFVAPAHILQNITHHVDARSGRIHCRWIFLDLRLNGEHTPEELFDLPVVLTAAETLHEIFDRIFAAETLLGMQSAALAAVDELLRCATPRATLHPRRLDASLRYIRENYRTPISVATLAALEHTSESNLYALFRRELGVSLISYINSYRLSLAAERLASTKESVAAVALAVGIPDGVYFSRLFQRAYRVTPTQYRHAHR